MRLAASTAPKVTLRDSLSTCEPNARPHATAASALVEACSQISDLRFVALVFSCTLRAKCQTERYGSICACGSMFSDLCAALCCLGCFLLLASQMQDRTLRQPLRLWKHVLRSLFCALLPWLFLAPCEPTARPHATAASAPVEAGSQISDLRFVALVFSCTLRCRVRRVGVRHLGAQQGRPPCRIRLHRAAAVALAGSGHTGALHRSLRCLSI